MRSCVHVDLRREPPLKRLSTIRLKSSLDASAFCNNKFPELSPFSNVPAIRLNAFALTACIRQRLLPHALATTTYSASLLRDLKQEHDTSPHIPTHSFSLLIDPQLHVLLTFALPPSQSTSMIASVDPGGCLNPRNLNIGSAVPNRLVQSSMSRSFALWNSSIARSNDLEQCPDQRADLSCFRDCYLP